MFCPKAPFYFEPHNLRQLTVNAGGLTYPAHPYDMDFANANERRSCMRATVEYAPLHIEG